MVARAGYIKDRIGDGGCARGYGQGAHAALQRGDALLEDILGGVGQAAVDVAGVGQAEARGRVLGIMEYIGACLVDGDCACI